MITDRDHFFRSIVINEVFVDPKILQKILAQLMANNALSEFMSGAVSAENGKLQLVLTGNSEKLDIDQVRMLLKTLSENIAASGEAEELFDITAVGPNVIAVIVNTDDDEFQFHKPLGKRHCRTLRDSIDAEWPW